MVGVRACTSVHRRGTSVNVAGVDVTRCVRRSSLDYLHVPLEQAHSVPARPPPALQRYAKKHSKVEAKSD